MLGDDYRDRLAAVLIGGAAMAGLMAVVDEYTGAPTAKWVALALMALSLVGGLFLLRDVFFPRADPADPEAQPEPPADPAGPGWTRPQRGELP